MNARDRTAIVFCVATWLAVSGCGLSQVSTPRPVPEETRTSLGTVAVVPARYAPEVGLDVFAVGKLSGAAKGTACGAVVPFTLGVLPGSLTGAGIAAAAGAVVGGVVGTWKAVPGRQADELRGEAKELLEGSKVSERIAEQVYRLAVVPRSGQTTLYLPDIGPLSASQPEDYPLLAKQGVDSVLEISVREFGLSPSRSIDDPAKTPFRLYLEVKARLNRLVNGEVLYERVLRASTQGTFVLDQWRGGGVALLEEQLTPVEAAVAERVADDVFRLYIQPSQRGSGSP